MDKEVFFFDNGPSWRWDYVSTFVEAGKELSRRPEDNEFRDAYNFLRRWKNGQMPDMPQLKRDYPVLYRAHLLYCNPMSEKFIVEAGLLTDVKKEDLAKYVAQDIPVIDTYEHYFFDVRPKLEARGYILNQVLMPSVGKGMHSRDFDFMYKTLAYCAGWTVFSEFIDHRNSSSDTVGYLTQNFRDSTLKLGWLATQRLNINNYNAIEVIDRCIQLMALEHDKGREIAKDTAAAMMNDLLQQCRMAILPAKEQVSACEPRVSEVMGGEKFLKFGEPIPVRK